VDVFDVTLAARPFLRDVCVAAACDLALFSALPGDAQSIAARLGVPARRLRALLDALALEGVVARRENGFFAHGERPARPDVPVEGLGALADVIRRDRPLPVPDETRLRYHDHLATAGAEAARETASRLLARERERERARARERDRTRAPSPAPRTPAPRILDAGGGIGTYTAALLDADPDATAILVDTDDVIPLARDRLARFGARVDLASADLTSTSTFFLPRPDPPASVVLLANVIHLFDASTCASMVSRLAARLAPGGLLAIKDLHVAPDRTGPAAAIYFALNMAAFTDGGDVHDDDTILRWIRDAGLIDPRIVRLDVSPDTILVTAVRPA
jgi:SAM-dependent methyltransferase